MINIVHNIDNMKWMKTLPDKYFDLVIDDPPYHEGANKGDYYRGGNRKHYTVYKNICTWKVPGQSYFDEIFRISKHQIIWGINYYNIKNPGHGRIIWDKKNDNEGNGFSDCEIAFCSLINSVKIFRYLWNGFLMEKQKHGREIKIHPTQKPVSLYSWCLKNYAKPGWKIGDLHVGSGSSRIACYDMGFD